VNPVCAIVCILLVSLASHAEEDRIMPDEAVASLQMWMDANIEEWVFPAVNLDREAVDEFLEAARQELAAAQQATGQPGREAAEHLLGLLERFESTEGYAVWIRSCLDKPLMARAPSDAAPEAGRPPLPTPQEEARALWLNVMTLRPEPAKAREYLPHIKPIFQSESVPAELVWVAEVESAFNPEAKSPVGAVGLFQLMPETAKSLGLSTWFPDERRNAEKNARAAAQYLQYLYDRFGDWRLAIAAYNAGPTRVSRLLRKSDTYSYDAIAHQLPSETRNYVAKVEATLLVREGVELASLAPSEG
jgi:membrane-bound lytic murein transglycosylase D